MTILPGILSMFFWGIAIYLAATVSRKIGNVLTLFWMQLFGLAVGLVYFIANISTFQYAQIPAFLPVLFLIALFQIIAYLSFYRGMEKGLVSLVSPLGSTWSLITAVLGVVIYHEVLKFHQVLAIASIIIGILIISVDLKSIVQTKKLEFLSGVREGLLSMLGWGVAWFLTVIPTRNLDWFLPAFIFRIILIIMLALYIAFQKHSFIPQKGKFPLTQLLIIGFFDMLAFMSLSIGISQTNSSIIAPIASANTIVVIGLAVIFLKEKLKLNQIIGTIGILIGIILISL